MTAQVADMHVLSAGAAQGLVEALAPRFLAETGVSLRATFGAVGAIREKLLAGEPCDALISTQAMIDAPMFVRSPQGLSAGIVWRNERRRHVLTPVFRIDCRAADQQVR